MRAMSSTCATFKKALQLREKTEWWPLLKIGGSHQLSMLGLLYLVHNFPNIKHIASLYNRSIAYLAGMKMIHRKSILHSLFKCIDDMYFFPCTCFETGTWDKGPFSIKTNVTHILFSICKNKMKSRIVWWVTILAYHLWIIYYHLWMMPRISQETMPFCCNFFYSYSHTSYILTHSPVCFDQVCITTKVAK